MYRIAFFFLAFVAASANGGFIMPRQVPELDGRIVGGTDAKIEQFPHQVSVRVGNSHSCGGSIYNASVIITAGHCIFTSFPLSWYSVQYGVDQLSSEGNVIKAKSLVRHPDYNSSSINNDVALIFLESDMSLSAKAQPIPLASISPDVGAKAVVSGWGTLSEGGTSSSKLQQVGVEIVDLQKCQKQYSGVNTITSAMLCAGVPKGGKDACQGDSGGPLVVDGVLAGIVSWGVGCARPDYSGVYSNVANLRTWIDSILKGGN